MQQIVKNIKKIIGEISNIAKKSKNEEMQILASKLILETVIQQGATSYEHPVDAMQKISEIDEFGGHQN